MDLLCLERLDFLLFDPRRLGKLGGVH